MAQWGNHRFLKGGTCTPRCTPFCLGCIRCRWCCTPSTSGLSWKLHLFTPLSCKSIKAKEKLLHFQVKYCANGELNEDWVTFKQVNQEMKFCRCSMDTHSFNFARRSGCTGGRWSHVGRKTALISALTRDRETSQCYISNVLGTLQTSKMDLIFTMV